MVSDVQYTVHSVGGRTPDTTESSAAPPTRERSTLPFRQFIVKVHSRCDLACDYCYVYTMADQRWRSRPPAMSPETIEHTAARIAEHAEAHRLGSVDVVLHGGEPLLAGPERIGHCVTALRGALGPAVAARVTVQTNGTLLGAELLGLFDRLGVAVGVSLDGDRAAQDRHRRRPGGQGSHARVARALTELTRDRYRHLFAGLLCAVDLRNDPMSTYHALLEFSPPAVDFLLPHGNWSAPPPGRDPGSPTTPYADWLIEVFDRWYGAPVRQTRIRLFEEIIHVLLGGGSRIEDVGLSPVLTVVVETDGAIEHTDVLASTYPGAAVTGLRVADDPFDAALSLPGFVAQRLGADALAPTCRECPVHRVCGAGLYAHRYLAGNGFANPSVYCPDLFRLIGHIRRAVVSDLTALRTRTPAGPTGPTGLAGAG